MEDYTIISLVGFMMMAIPVGSQYMNFNITCPKRITNANAGIEKIRTRIGMLFTGFNYSHRNTGSCFEVGIVQSVLPDKGEKIFVHFEKGFENEKIGELEN